MDDGIRKSADPTPDGKNAIADNSDEKSDKTTSNIYFNCKFFSLSN